MPKAAFPTHQKKVKETVEENSVYHTIHFIWDALLTFFVALFFYFRNRDDKSIDLLWEKKANTEDLTSLRDEIREMRREAREDRKAIHEVLRDLVSHNNNHFERESK